MSKVIIDNDKFKNILHWFLGESVILDLIDMMNDNDVYIQDIENDSICSWISVDDGVPSDGDVYEVTSLSDDDSIYREFAYFNSTTREWRSHFSGSLLHVLAWKPHTELFTAPFA